MREEEPRQETAHIINRDNLRQHLYLAEQAATGGTPIYPGTEWGQHYATDIASRNSLIQGLLDGTVNPDEAASQLKPDGLVYDAGELESPEGLSGLMSRVRDATAQIAYYDYERFAQFITKMGGTGIDAQVAKEIYDRIAQSRTRKVLLDAYGFTGRQQINQALLQESAQTIANFARLGSGEKIFEALKLNWAAQDLRALPTSEVEKVISQLNEGERAVFDALQDPYRQFVKVGNPASFDELAQAVKSALGQPVEEPEAEAPSEETPPKTEPESKESPQEGQKKGDGQGQGTGQGEGQEGQQGQDQGEGEGQNPGQGGLPGIGGPGDQQGQGQQPGPGQTPPQTQPTPTQSEQKPEEQQPQEPPQDPSQDIEEEFKDKSGPTPTPDNPVAPPDYQEEQQISKERGAPGVFYYITPAGTSTAPMLGHYAASKKSHFDPASRTWRSGPSTLTPYTQTVTGTERQTITSAGPISGRLNTVQIPTNYALDLASLQYQGARPEIFRDQNGCFHIQAPGSCSFSIDFLKEPIPFIDPPTPEDLQLLYQGELSPETETFLRALTGSAIDRAKALGAFIRSHHFYIADGNLDAAQALKYQFSQLPFGEFFRSIDGSKYLECTLTHTLFVGIMRKLGIPARVVSGDNVDQVTNGRAQIDSNTAHLWAEIWDGSRWIKFDVTPPPEHPQKQDQDKQQEGQQAEDNGTDEGEEGKEGQEGEPGEDGQDQGGEQGGQSGGGTPGESGQPKEGQGKGKRVPRPDMKFKDKQQSEATDQQMQTGQKALQEAQETMKRMQQARQKLEQDLQKAQSFQDLDRLGKQADQADIFEEMKDELKEKLEAIKEAKKEELRETLEEMGEDGFIEEEEKERLLEAMQSGQTKDLDQVRHQVEVEGKLFTEYQAIKERVKDKVDEWFEYFVERLPKQRETSVDEAIMRRKGVLNRRQMMKPINLIMGTVKNPREIVDSTKPLFLAGIVVDFSRSVITMDPTKKAATEELLVFYCELFDRIVQTHGYMRFAIDAFHDKVISIKNYDQDYSSSERYEYPDGVKSTVKVRMMKALKTEGGTYILPALKHAAKALNEQSEEYPDYLSAMYFIGDGEDSHEDPTHTTRIRRFVNNLSPENGFGPHLRSAIFLGNEQDRRQLADIFRDPNGNDHVTVCSNFDQLIELSMLKFDEDIQEYLSDKVQ